MAQHGDGWYRVPHRRKHHSTCQRNYRKDWATLGARYGRYLVHLAIVVSRKFYFYNQIGEKIQSHRFFPECGTQLDGQGTLLFVFIRSQCNKHYITFINILLLHIRMPSPMTNTTNFRTQQVVSMWLEVKIQSFLRWMDRTWQ